MRAQTVAVRVWWNSFFCWKYLKLEWLRERNLCLSRTISTFSISLVNLHGWFIYTSHALYDMVDARRINTTHTKCDGKNHHKTQCTIPLRFATQTPKHSKTPCTPLSNPFLIFHDRFCIITQTKALRFHEQSLALLLQDLFFLVLTRRDIPRIYAIVGVLLSTLLNIHIQHTNLRQTYTHTHAPQASKGCDRMEEVKGNK